MARQEHMGNFLSTGALLTPRNPRAWLLQPLGLLSVLDGPYL